VPDVIAGLARLGYPAYFATIIGVWKLLAVATMLAPGLPRLKEWAYAGLFFALSGAAISHAISGDTARVAALPLMILGIVFTSWVLQPARRAAVATKPSKSTSIPSPARA
jgi:DoxX-like protein